MRIADRTMEALLKQGGTLTDEDLAELVEQASRSRRPLQEVALQKEAIKELDLAKAFAEYINIPFVSVEPKDIPSDVLSRIPERIARQYNAILFKVDNDGKCHLAMDDPDDIQAVNFIEKQIGNNIKLYLATRENILTCLENYSGDVDKKLNDVIDVQREDDASSQKVTEDDIAEDSPIAKTINLLLEYAIKSSASDIHIEPREGYVQIRYRVDGALKEVNRLPRNVLGALVSRIKILSNLKIDERRVPQDGRFKIRLGGKQYAFRVSTLPIADGEKIVMRILNESNQAITLEELGYWGKSIRTIKDALTESNGIVLVTGPTGSGKSTSLFSVLTMLNQPDVNISTIEDPVEYKVPGVNQTQTNAKAGMTFASGLRALLRQDPNIIMVGEIRDGETANLGVQAALTGHLVFSTLHTNNAATCLPRLLDMQIEPFLIASTVRAVVGQRLVRRLCMNCRQQYQPDDIEIKSFYESFKISPEELSALHKLEEEAANDNIGGDTPLGTNDQTIVNLFKPSDHGCDECHGSGFKGRVGIYEVLGNSPKIEKLIMANATATDIQNQAIEEGMVTMQVDGIIKAFRGITTLEEVLRATKE
ncbi:Flp pilus assembly complex ATPase component TadA [Candidatus Saccharibacteria bacterium]|nr:Flp pilus assembly complex ATPase component TadA [Candidatus Saccharibacteria bacterium]